MGIRIGDYLSKRHILKSKPEEVYQKALNSCRNDNKYLFGKLHDVEEENRHLKDENSYLKARIKILQERVW